MSDDDKIPPFVFNKEMYLYTELERRQRRVLLLKGRQRSVDEEQEKRATAQEYAAAIESMSNDCICGAGLGEPHRYPCAESLPAALEAQAATLDARIATLTRERDEARRNYRFMVERAADKHLPRYREMGAKMAALERERDEARADLARFQRFEAEAHAIAKAAQDERDEARAEVARLREELSAAEDAVRVLAKESP